MSDTAAPAVSQEAKPKQAKKNHLSGGFFRFVLTRFLLIIPTVFILVTVVFFVMRATGDPISAALGGRLTPDELQKRVHAAGYDRPLIVQYIDYLGGGVAQNGKGSNACIGSVIASARSYTT